MSWCNLWNLLHFVVGIYTKNKLVKNIFYFIWVIDYSVSKAFHFLSQSKKMQVPYSIKMEKLIQDVVQRLCIWAARINEDKEPEEEATEIRLNIEKKKSSAREENFTQATFQPAMLGSTVCFMYSNFVLLVTCISCAALPSPCSMLPRVIWPPLCKTQHC